MLLEENKKQRKSRSRKMKEVVSRGKRLRKREIEMEERKESERKGVENK